MQLYGWFRLNGKRIYGIVLSVSCGQALVEDVADCSKRYTVPMKAFNVQDSITT